MVRPSTALVSLLLSTASLVAGFLNAFTPISASTATAFLGSRTRYCALTSKTSSSTLEKSGQRNRNRRPRMGLEEIQVFPKASEEQISKLGARNWPTWGCGVSQFPWEYEGTETCLILEGDVTVTPDDDRQPVTVGAGDVCVFPDGMKCTWDVRAAIKKHYKFE